MNGRPASKRYRQFAPEYVSVGFNGTQAVLNLGWTDKRKSANVIAHRLLSNVNCIRLIEKHVMSAKISADEILEELSTMARAPCEKVSEAGKLKALELSGKANKLFVDRVESTDTTERDATAQSLVKLIQDASIADNLTESQTAVQLYPALSKIPAYADIAAWPEQFQQSIRDSLTHPEAAPIDGGNQ